MELYGRGQPRQYIERFTALLSEGPVGSGSPRRRGEGGVIAGAMLGLEAARRR